MHATSTTRRLVTTLVTVTLAIAPLGNFAGANTGASASQAFVPIDRWGAVAVSRGSELVAPVAPTRAGEDGDSPEQQPEADEADEADEAEEPLVDDAEAPPEDAPPSETASGTDPAGPDPGLPEGPERPEEPRVAGRPAKGLGLMIAGGSLLGLGIAGIITTSMLTIHCSYDGPLSCKYRNQDSFLVPMMAAPAALGIVLLAVGLGYHVRYRRWERWTPPRAALVPTFGPNGGGLAYSMQF